MLRRILEKLGYGTAEITPCLKWKWRRFAKQTKSDMERVSIEKKLIKFLVPFCFSSIFELAVVYNSVSVRHSVENLPCAYYVLWGTIKETDTFKFDGHDST